MNLLLLFVISYLSLIIIEAASPENKPSTSSCPNRPYRDQCGGLIGGNLPFTGETCCPDGYICVVISEYWSQCNPDTPSPKPVSLPDDCPSNSFCTGKDDGNYEISDNNHYYVACVAGLAYCMPCPANLVFDEKEDKCLYPPGHPAEKYNNVNGGSSSPQSPQTPQSHPDPCPGDEFCVGKSAGDYSIESEGYSGNHYVACSGGIAYCMPCPANLVFNQANDKCEYSSSTGTKSTPALIERSAESKN